MRCTPAPGSRWAGVLRARSLGALRGSTRAASCCTSLALGSRRRVGLALERADRASGWGRPAAIAGGLAAGALLLLAADAAARAARTAADAGPRRRARARPRAGGGAGARASRATARRSRPRGCAASRARGGKRCRARSRCRCIVGATALKGARVRARPARAGCARARSPPGAVASFASTLARRAADARGGARRRWWPYAASGRRARGAGRSAAALAGSGAMSDAYAAAGVDTAQADAGVGGDRRACWAGSSSAGRRASVLRAGHYASVLRIAPTSASRSCTDGVGSKLVVAEQAGRLETVGIDCVAMNVNDVVCVGAEPIALVDYLAVEEADPERLARIAEGLRVGAAGGRHRDPRRRARGAARADPRPSLARAASTSCGAAFGTVALDAMVTGEAIAAGDALVGVPSSGLHSNGYTLARRALLSDGGLGLDDRPPELRRRVRGRRPAGADGHLRARGPRAAALRRPGARPRAHHRRRARQPAAPARRRRLRRSRSRCPSRRSSGSSSARRTCPTTEMWRGVQHGLRVHRRRARGRARTRPRPCSARAIRARADRHVTDARDGRVAPLGLAYTRT